MKLRVGFEIHYEFPQPTPMIMVLGIHFTRASDIIVPDHLTTRPTVPVTPYRDGFGNWCSRLVAPAGPMRLAADGVVRDSGLPDPVFASAVQHAIEDLPADTLVYLLGSRYCETDRLSEIAWQLFENTPPGWARVQAICDFVHRHIAFGYEHARATKTA
jgi:transglutaminase-like putative cysteine protease